MFTEQLTPKELAVWLFNISYLADVCEQHSSHNGADVAMHDARELRRKFTRSLGVYREVYGDRAADSALYWINRVANFVSTARMWTKQMPGYLHKHGIPVSP